MQVETHREIILLYIDAGGAQQCFRVRTSIKKQEADSALAVALSLSVLMHTLDTNQRTALALFLSPRNLLL